MSEDNQIQIKTKQIKCQFAGHPAVVDFIEKAKLIEWQDVDLLRTKDGTENWAHRWMEEASTKYLNDGIYDIFDQ